MTRLPPQATDLHSLDAGFTLLELLIALSLLVMIATITAPRYLINGSSTQLRVFTTSVVAGLKNARDQAIRNRDNIIVIFHADLTTRTPNPREHLIQIPTGLNVRLTSLASCGGTTENARLHFKSDGSACETTVLISAPSGDRTIFVNGLHGGITHD